MFTSVRHEHNRLEVLTEKLENQSSKASLSLLWQKLLHLAPTKEKHRNEVWNELALFCLPTGIHQVLTVNIQLPPLEEWINAEHAKLSWPRRLEYNVEVKGSAALIDTEEM